jgi:2-haloacid dehalogenase
MLTAMLEHTGLADRITMTISADEIRTYKPATGLYRHAGEQTGTAPEQVAHISADWFDACGAENVGMQGISENRTGRPAETWGPTPDLTADSFEIVADSFGV